MENLRMLFKIKRTQIIRQKSLIIWIFLFSSKLRKKQVKKDNKIIFNCPKFNDYIFLIYN